MEFDLQWLLLGLPVAFALGWLASRLDLRQWKREQHESPKAYYKGLNLLLNEQHDKAIDAFIEAVQHDPDTTELHFALGNLFRRRGEYERAVRVHEHLLQRGDLASADRERAQHALAQDFMKAGLFDRAEQAFEALEGSPFDTEARLALLALHERSREWRAAAEVAARLERAGSGSFKARIAHYWCELAQEAQARQQEAEATEALQRAREAAPQAPRPLILAGQRARARGEHREVLQAWGTLMAAHPAAFNLVAGDYADSARQLGEPGPAYEQLEALYRRSPSSDLLAALALLDEDPARHRRRLLAHLQQHPSLAAAQGLLQVGGTAFDEAEAIALREAVGRSAKPLQRYRCAACAFEAQNYFWQCPACLGWDTYPPQRLEDL
ncbi:MAG: lipopolysaccharide assembly protein LapB [Piscinibacter sp.]|uniref:lipopolysaccharide assembly protein LapB n=1 Tax=Piscinibacter sp. TaxID=1903157 RepID=UPI00258F6B2B|nr:lipopolysaccharide assembly protein LapB [Piscinibacter sp.]MCW5662995.1 lipopolysaccharide assembly protein LapB [Piscinibacter sp.]